MDNIQIIHESKNIEYTPDFIIKLTNPKINIAIDIEEPYTLKEIEGKTSVSSEEKYSKIAKIRTKVANELRWLVVVFTEEQIVSNPTECCKFIAEYTETTLVEEDLIGNFSSVTSVAKLNFTEERNVNKLKKDKYREKYLAKFGVTDDFSEIEKTEAVKTLKIDNDIDNKNKVVENKDKIIPNKVNATSDKKTISKEIIKEKSVSIIKNGKTETESEQLKLIKKVPNPDCDVLQQLWD